MSAGPVIRRAARQFGFWGAASAACGGVLWGLIGAMDAAGIPDPRIDLRLAKQMAERSQKLARQPSGPNVQTVGLLGNSMVVSYPEGRTVHDRVRQRVRVLAKGKQPIILHSLATKGTGPYDNYLLADVIAAARPDQLVVPFNLASLGAAWHRLFLRPELAGWVAPQRLGEALGLPLYRIGLTADRLLFYVSLRRLVGVDPWYRFRQQQVRLGTAWADIVARLDVAGGGGAGARFESALARRLQAETLVSPREHALRGLSRYNARGLRNRYREALGGVGIDDPVLRAFGATLRVFQTAGIHTIVYVHPVNVEHIARMGMLDEEGLRRTLGSIERVARDAGAEFADLHDVIPDAGFRDAPGHFSTDETEVDGPKWLAREIAPVILSEVVRSIEARR